MTHTGERRAAISYGRLELAGDRAERPADILVPIVVIDAIAATAISAEISEYSTPFG
jgi:hypothetical protein